MILGLMLETSAFESLYGSQIIYIVNSVDKTKLSCNTPTNTAPQFLYKLTPFINFKIGRERSAMADFKEYDSAP